MTTREKALEFSTRKHAGQKRKDGKDYITHPIAVAEIAHRIFYSEYLPNWDDTPNDLIEIEVIQDELYILSLLHDTYEDTDATLEEIEQIFGKSVSYGVMMLSNKDKVMTYYDFIMRLVSKPWDWSIMVVKRADLQHNMSDLQEGSLKDKYRFAEYILKKKYDD